MSEVMRPAFWLAAVQIMGINILLSGDNAVVIALAVRALPPKERFWGMVLGAGAAAVLLILFTGIVATLMQLPYLKLAGGLALFWVAVKLVTPQAHDAEDTPEAVEDLWRAVRVVVVANIVMKSRQRHCSRGGCQRQLLSARARTCRQHTCRHCGERSVPRDHRTLPDRRVGRRRLAGLDCRRIAAGGSGHCTIFFGSDRGNPGCGLRDCRRHLRGADGSLSGQVTTPAGRAGIGDPPQLERRSRNEQSDARRRSGGSHRVNCVPA